MPTINPLITLITYAILEGNATIKQACDYAIEVHNIKIFEGEELQPMTPLTVFDLKTIQTEIGNFLELEYGNEAESEFPHGFGQFEYIDTLLTGIASINDINEFLNYLNEDMKKEWWYTCK